MEKKEENSNLKSWELVNFCEFDKYAAKAYCSIHDVDESLNLGDITQVDETKLSDFNMICGGSPCFVAGTKIMTDGGYKNIEDIKIGDLVLSHLNRFMPVVKIGGEKAQRIYSLRVQGFLRTECTDYHPFYCKKSRDSVPEKIRLKDIRKGYYIGSHINNKEENKFNLSNEDCWILGRYVADGHIRKNKRKERINSYQYQLILSIGDNKVDELKANVKSRHYSCYPHTKSTHRVVFSSMKLVNFIIEHGFGQRAENKNIPNFILDLPIDKLKTFLDGYMSGDGCAIEEKYQATTVSKDLAMKLTLAIQKVYRVGCRVYYDKRPDKCIIDGREVNQKDTYMIRFMQQSQKQSWFISDNIVWYPVKKIENTNKIEDVFNIEVEEDHTYTANNMITFNCQDFSVAGKQNGSVWRCNECKNSDGTPTEWNPLTIHYTQRHKCPCCGSENIDKSRSSLLVEYLRVIRHNKPNFGIYENVKNIVGKKFKETFKLFTDELEEYGYSVYWKVLNAKDYGIPQNRERVYLIFIKKELDNGKFKFPKSFDNGIRLKDILELEVDEKYYISDEKVQRFLTNLNNKDALLYDACQVKREGKSREYNEYCPILTARDYKDPRLVNDNQVKQLGNISESNSRWSNPQTGRIYSPNGVSPTLNTCGGGQREPKILQIGKLNSSQDGIVVNPKGIAKTHTAGHNNMPKIICGIDKSINGTKIIDNANCITAREDRGISNRKSEGTAVLETPDYLYCLDANYYKGTTPEQYVNKHRRQLVFENSHNIQADGEYTNTSPAFIRKPLKDLSRTIKADSHPVGMYDGVRIRKLTPLECFRLMGFSDKDFYAVKDAGISNSQLYKQSGNSIVVDVLYYIYVELYKAMPYLFDDLKLSSFFSGVGAFEVALDRFYDGINTGNFTQPQVE